MVTLERKVSDRRLHFIGSLEKELKDLKETWTAQYMRDLTTEIEKLSKENAQLKEENRRLKVENAVFVNCRDSRPKRRKTAHNVHWAPVAQGAVDSLCQAANTARELINAQEAFKRDRKTM